MVKRAFVFPGQGIQLKGDEIQYILSLPVSSSFIRESSELLNLDIKELLLGGVSPKDTEVSQIVTYVLSLSLFYALDSKGFKANFVAGHSLGEYSALTAGEAISIEDGLRIVRQRGKIMADACQEIKGGMIAVIGLNKDEVLEAIRDIPDVEAVNFNSPKQTVISGKESALTIAEGVLKERGAKRIIRLEVAGPFHSSFLKEYSERFYKECIIDIKINKPKIGFISSVNGRLIEDEREIKECLRIQMYSPVRWVDVVKTLEELGNIEVIEVGASNVLTGLIKQTSSKLNILGNALEVLEKNL
ncbi:MAG: ACP S-malonyltransferase [bacterium]